MWDSASYSLLEKECLTLCKLQTQSRAVALVPALWLGLSWQPPDVRAVREVGSAGGVMEAQRRATDSLKATQCCVAELGPGTSVAQSSELFVTMTAAPSGA